MNRVVCFMRLLSAAVLLHFSGVALAQPAATTTTFTVSPAPSYAGQRITLSASVAATAPTGVVTFLDGTSTIGVVSVNSSGSATLVLGNLGVGSRTLTAAYGGDAYYAPSVGTATHTVTSATPTLVLTAPSSAVVGQGVTMSASFNNGFVPTGTVTFSVSSTPIGTVTLVGGAASLNTASLAAGSHVLSASYGGDANNQSAVSGTVSLTVSARAAMTWQYGHDAMNRLNTVVNGIAKASYIYYDKLGRPIQTQQPANTGSGSPTVIDFGWDLQDNLTSVIDPRLLTTTYTVKGLGSRVQESSPDRATTTYTFDARRLVSSLTDARGKTTTFSYDALGRLTGLSYPTTPATTFEYDGGSSPYAAAAGELTKITDESGSSSYVYDSMGRLGTKTVVIGSKTFTVSYGWGNSGIATDKLTSIVYPGGSRVNYSYDSGGSINAISVNSVNSNGVGFSGSSTSLLSSVTYTVDGTTSGWKWSDGKARTIGYDSYGQVNSYVLGDPYYPNGNHVGSEATLTRDAAGRITAVNHIRYGSTAAPVLNQSYAYDDLDRLVLQTHIYGTFGYTYDASGNRTENVVDGYPYANTVSSTSNRLTQATRLYIGTQNITYDAMGNPIVDGAYYGFGFDFGYDDRGRMVSASSTIIGTVTYSFNGLGQRVRKLGSSMSVPTGAAYFVYDEQGKLLGEYDASGNVIYETIYMENLPTGVLKYTGTAGGNDLAAVIYNLHADHLATPRMITDQGHVPVWRWDKYIEAFGSNSPISNLGAGDFIYNQRYPGQVWDAETRRFQNWHREYDPSMGRYTQSDPIGLAGGTNPYLYVDGNPLSTVDPYGLWAIGDPLSQDIVDAVTGFGDGASFGLSRRYRDWRDIDGGVDVCSNLYLGGDFVGSTFPAWGRLAYMVRVGAVGRRATTLETALAASAERNAVKAYFRGPIAKWFSDYKSAADALRKYGDDAEAIARAAGRSNPYFNTLAFTGIYASSLNLGQKASDCQCRREK